MKHIINIKIKTLRIMSSNYCIEINGKNRGSHHKGGYCSDPYDFTDIEDFSFFVTLLMFQIKICKR